MPVYGVVFELSVKLVCKSHTESVKSSFLKWFSFFLVKKVILFYF